MNLTIGENTIFGRINDIKYYMKMQINYYIYIIIYLRVKINHFS